MDATAQTSTPAPTTAPSLIATRGLLPLFVVQWFGAFADNALKSAFGLMVSYGGADLFGLSPQVAVTLGGAVFMPPFFLFSGISGRLSDSIDKQLVVRWTRVAEVILAIISSIAIMIHSAAAGTVRHVPLRAAIDHLRAGEIFDPAATGRAAAARRRQCAVRARPSSPSCSARCSAASPSVSAAPGSPSPDWSARRLPARSLAFFVPPAPPAADAEPFRFSLWDANRAPSPPSAGGNRCPRGARHLLVLDDRPHRDVGASRNSPSRRVGRRDRRQPARRRLGRRHRAGSAATSKLLAGQISARHTPIGGVITGCIHDRPPRIRRWRSARWPRRERSISGLCRLGRGPPRARRSGRRRVRRRPLHGAALCHATARAPPITSARRRLPATTS